MSNDGDDRTAPRLTRGATYFLTADVARAVEYYGSVLGFRVEYVAGEPPQFAIVSRDGLPLMFRRTAEPASIQTATDQGGAWDAYFWVEGVEELADELARAGATLTYGPDLVEAHGTREFAIRDPDGRVLAFGEPVAG